MKGTAPARFASALAWRIFRSLPTLPRAAGCFAIRTTRTTLALRCLTCFEARVVCNGGTGKLAAQYSRHLVRELSIARIGVSAKSSGREMSQSCCSCFASPSQMSNTSGQHIVQSRLSLPTPLCRCAAPRLLFIQWQEKYHLGSSVLRIFVQTTLPRRERFAARHRPSCGALEKYDRMGGGHGQRQDTVSAEPCLLRCRIILNSLYLALLVIVSRGQHSTPTTDRSSYIPYAKSMHRTQQRN